VNELKHSVVRGGFAKGLAQAANFAGRIGTLMIMARLLQPAEFGLVAMVGAVTGVFNLLRDAGLSMATIQRPKVTHEQVSTLFWVNAGLGALLSVASVAIAPALVAFYGEPRLGAVAAVMGLGFLLNGLGVQHAALLQRQMRFTTVAIIETVSLLVSTTVGIALAMAGFGYWALVAMSLAVPAINSAGFWLTASWIPGRPRRKIGLRSMMHFGGTLTLNSIVVYVAYNLDKMLLGRFAGAEVLGVYGRAYQLVNIPTENFNSAVGGVAFSALSRVQGDPPRFRGYFLKGYSLALAVTVPIAVACGVFAEDIVLVALGAKWAQAAPLLRLLAPTIVVFALINPLGWLMMSSNLVGRSLRMALVIAPTVTAAYFVGLPWGATGVAAAYSIAMVALALPMSIWGVHKTVVTVRDLAEVASRPLASAVAACAAYLLARPLLTQVGPAVLRLALEGGLLFTVYGGVLLFVLGQKELYLELFRRLRSPPASAAAPGTLAAGQ
jgi:PST family polysaccharide transporter